MWVIKLGGSLLGSPELPLWLDSIARHGDGKMIVVPGGGPFADAVREAQRMSGVDDRTAHQMAVMAMDQYGVMMKGLNANVVTASSELEIAERGWQHRAMVWLPSQMVCADEQIPADWETTSDSLAAWLAGKLNADRLLLVKSRTPVTAEAGLSALIVDGLVDANLQRFLADATFDSYLVHKSRHAILASPADLARHAVRVMA